MDLDGSDPVNVSNDSLANYDADVSADGWRIVFNAEAGQASTGHRSRPSSWRSWMAPAGLC